MAKRSMRDMLKARAWNSHVSLADVEGIGSQAKARNLA
jgi:hypothetical protein